MQVPPPNLRHIFCFPSCLAESLYVGYFAIQKRNFEIFVNVDLLGAEIDDLFWFTERSFYLRGRLALVNLLRGWWWRLLCLCTSAIVSSSARVVSLIIAITIAIAIAALLIATLAIALVGAVINGEESGHRVFYLGRVHACQRPFGKLEDNVCLEERSRTDVVAGIAVDDADNNLIFG